MITQGNGQFSRLLREVESMDSVLAESIREERTRASRDATNSYYAGESGRLNPVPSGVQPLGSDADEHYSSDRSYYLIAERGRHAGGGNGATTSELAITRGCGPFPTWRTSRFSARFRTGKQRICHCGPGTCNPGNPTTFGTRTTFRRLIPAFV